MKVLGFFSLWLVGAIAYATADKLVVHEWGTFTSLQDEAGRTLGGINTEDEPLPRFTHNIDQAHVLRKNALPPSFSKGIPEVLPRVTMRLETPVVYFYPPAGSVLPLVLDVKVRFRGGWLTEYYPNGEVNAPGAFRELTPSTLGTLAWHRLEVGVTNQGPETSEHVWTAPRAVKAASVRTPKGESEKYLFYRGVGHVESPLRVVRESSNDRLSIFSQPGAWAVSASSPVRRLWLASFREDGTAAFRQLDSVVMDKDGTKELGSTSGRFSEDEYHRSNPDKLQTEMHAALVEDGLFADEADALLITWELSYFKSAGLRLFFLLPRALTDHRLPLELSMPAEVERVMVARIELVTPEQRKLLRELATGPVPQRAWARRVVEEGWPVLRGKMPGVYRDLGRFRNALLLDEVQRTPTPALRMFVALNRLDNFRVEE